MAHRKPQIVILTGIDDETADFVEERLAARGAEYLRINTDNLFDDLRVFFDPLRPHSGQFTWCGETFSLDSVRGVWHRRPVTPECPPTWTRGQSELAAREAFAAVWSALLVAPGWNRWINAPHAVAHAEYKPEQLRRAMGLGLPVPATIVTDQSDLAASFVRSHPIVVAKAVYEGFAPGNDGSTVTWATIVTTDDIAKSTLSPIPMILQVAIQPKQDLRVTVIDRQLWCAEIRYEEDDRPTRLDWRAAPNGSRAVPFELSSDLVDSLFALVESYDLKFAAIDLVRSHDGVVYFLELNACGQWGWLELEASFPIRDALIDCLLR